MTGRSAADGGPPRPRARSRRAFRRVRPSVSGSPEQPRLLAGLAAAGASPPVPRDGERLAHRRPPGVRRSRLARRPPRRPRCPPPPAEPDELEPPPAPAARCRHRPPAAQRRPRPRRRPGASDAAVRRRAPAARAAPAPSRRRARSGGASAWPCSRSRRAISSCGVVVVGHGERSGLEARPPAGRGRGYSRDLTVPAGSSSTARGLLHREADDVAGDGRGAEVGLELRPARRRGRAGLASWARRRIAAPRRSAAACRLRRSSTS